ncbi:phosphatidylinositol-binding protein scs2 [Linnemannia gamsii]|uniref:Phosphatidylinositol-binding protein scs2 n=1 Tax=Linnemannia gamsii TaxID=64522 RepID=A0ABQ7K1Z8_9FUNG|nr:phosphatidylinositol-binding protein scs2 [Linnemannia gamsii]
MSIELDPSSQLAFRRPLTEAIKESLIIRNPTQLPIAFKVKTTAPKQYCVRPNSGRIEPGQELEVQVQMQAMKEDPPADFKCKDKFLVQSVAITAEREQIASADLWPTMERDAKDQIREKKIRCAFLPPLEHAITQIQEEDENVSHTTVSTQQQNSQAIAPPVATAHIQSTSTTSAAPSLVSRDSYNSSNSTSTGTDAHKMKRDLDNAQHIIQNLQNSVKQLEAETNTLRQRKSDSASTPSAPTLTAVHVAQPQGFPASYVAGAALIAFIFAYLFF